MSARDVLAYIDFVFGLLWREEQRLDPTVEWQRDMSWDEIAACAGCDAPSTLAPGEPVSNVGLAIQLYWPGAVPA
jgi:hypothetical protein